MKEWIMDLNSILNWNFVWIFEKIPGHWSTFYVAPLDTSGAALEEATQPVSNLLLNDDSGHYQSLIRFSADAGWVRD